MKYTLLIYWFLGLCLLSSCSSCGENSATGSADSSITAGNGLEGIADELYGTAEERLQANINQMIDEQVEVSNAIHSKRVQAMIAGFELGMSRSQVKKHFLSMKQKKHLVRVRKRSKGSKKVYEYVYPLPLESGRANTQFNFDHQRGGGVYKLVCEPRKPRRQSKSDFLEEIHTLLNEWYGPHNFQLPNQHGCARYIWIAGNRHLDLYATAKDVQFMYTDLKTEIPPNIDGGGEERPTSEELL
ncbi:MAG: hypothetical protein ACRBFS_05840 [Aureispira sp.]